MFDVRKIKCMNSFSVIEIDLRQILSTHGHLDLHNE